MHNVVGLILGGGKGTRLYPLTEKRSKPAVPLGAKYRLIDIPISNCINSDIYRIYLLTQFNSVSLHSHIRKTYNFDGFHGGFVEILAAQQTPDFTDWYQGTADAVRKNLRYIKQRGIDYVLILSGDQLYRMDYAEMLATHKASGAEATIAALPVGREDAKSFGIMRLDDSGKVLGFLEKPQTDKEMDMVMTSPEWIDAHGLKSRGRDMLASMGIYLFNRDTLVDLLEGSDYEDFGKEVFPMAIRTRQVNVHLFDGYWEDIGTIRAFYEANLALAQPKPPFDFVVKDEPIYTRARFLPPTIVEGATIKRSLIADGCFIDQGSVIENSVIGLRCRIGKNCVIKNTILMGNDFYDDEQDETEVSSVPLGIGDHTHIDQAIIDKNCRIGNHVEIHGCDLSKGDHDVDPFKMRDGIAVLPKSSTIPDHWKMKT